MDSVARGILQSNYDNLWERNDLEVMKIIRTGRVRRSNLHPRYQERQQLCDVKDLDLEHQIS